MCQNNMQYSYPDLFVPEIPLPISITSFLAVISQLSSVTTYDTWKRHTELNMLKITLFKQFPRLWSCVEEFERQWAVVQEVIAQT